MFHYYKLFLLLLQFVIPVFIIGYKNRYDNGSKTLFRFFAAVMIVWIYIAAMRSVIPDIDLYLAVTDKERNLISLGDGAKNAFAYMLGWIPGVIISAIAWALVRAWRWMTPKLKSSAVKHNPDKISGSYSNHTVTPVESGAPINSKQSIPSSL